MLAIILFGLDNSSDAFLILKARETGISVALMPILWMVLHLSKSLSATPGGIFSDHFGRKKIITAGWFLYSAVYLGFGWVKSAEFIWVLFAIYGLFYGLTEGGERALVSELVTPPLRGTAYGLYNFAIGLATLPASVLMGFFWQKFGSPIAFTFGALMALEAAILLQFSSKEKNNLLN